MKVLQEYQPFEAGNCRFTPAVENRWEKLQRETEKAESDTGYFVENSFWRMGDND